MNTGLLWQDTRTIAGSLMLSHKLDPQQRIFICTSVNINSPASNYSVLSLTPPTLHSTNKQPKPAAGAGTSTVWISNPSPKLQQTK